MMQKTTVTLAPWVVTADDGDGGRYLLGPRWELFHVDAELDADAARAELPASFFDASHGVEAEPLPAASPRDGVAYVVSPRHSREAVALASALDALDDGCEWRPTSRLDLASAETTAPPVVVLLEAHEHGQPRLALESLGGSARVVWLGEALEGLQVGPVLDDVAAAARYEDATRNWSSVGAVEELGFGERWPSSVLPRLRADARPIARSVLRVLCSTRGSCVLIDEDRRVRLWSAMLEEAIAPEELVDEQSWSKGMLRDLEVEESSELPSLFFGRCSSPCDRDVALEPRFGKGFTARQARETTVGEAVERFCSWLAGRSSAPPPRLEARPARRYRLEHFHPFGPAYDAYCDRGSPAICTTTARDLISGELVEVPACLVPEPYEPPPEDGYCTAATTSGLAAFTSLEGAVLRGAMELLERNDFYPSFLHLAPAERVSPEVLPAGSGRDELVERIAGLRRLGLELTLLHYRGELGLPIVHSFLWDPEHGAMARGAGSDPDIARATLKATVEALQIMNQHRFVRESGLREGANAAYVEWATAEVTELVRGYLGQQPLAERPLPTFGDDAAMLEHLRQRLRARGTPLLVAELPCPIAGWHAVRVLMPGITCHGYGSSSDGGRRLLDPRFPYAVPI